MNNNERKTERQIKRVQNYSQQWAHYTCDFFFSFQTHCPGTKKAKTTDYLETCMFGFSYFLWRVTRSAQLPECTVTLNPVTHHINAHTDAQRGGRSQLLRC